jgi:hypothetical protein
MLKILDMRLYQQDTQYKDQQQQCGECGEYPADHMFIDVQWAVGSTGYVGKTCCGHLFEDAATISDSIIAHWKKY